MEYEEIEISSPCIQRIVNRSDVSGMEEMGFMQLGVCNAIDIFTVSRRSSENHMAIYTFGGLGTLTLDNCTHSLVPGSLVCVPSGTTNKIQVAEKEWHLVWAMLKPGDTWNSLFDVFNMLDFPKGEVFKTSVENIYSATEFTDTVMQQLLASQLDVCRHILTTSLTKEDGVKNSTKSNNLRRLNRLFDEVCLQLQCQWSIEDLTDRVHWSKAHLHRLCMQFYGMGPQQKIIQMRMNMASKLLADTDMPVQHVAELVGYQDLAGFSARFKKYWKVSPRQYRGQNG
ncbi:AraC family transcriptional regulator [Teredinibacter sp. KSP-S5-2]|uniref:helix-turn-helix transcriptional regulator n=1 Tax=Teredinibacter sp. KSP-S5-2 TaxID=3034506 RepID=UPI002934B428|nr:AraC family transcriptional regulator [Teredinibacter sp. KSP-S5-2]WNO11037.1 AraC family transcriptional regulator [Teredinibacter sp. KSP-S5-2]